MKQQMQNALERIGLPGTLGVGLLIFSAILIMAAIAPARTALVETKAETQTLEARLQRTAAGPERRDDQARLQTFLQAFPAPENAPEWLGKIYAVAEKEHLILAHGEYELSTDPKVKLARYRVDLPVKGSYPHIRAFVLAALEEVPTLSLDSVSFQKEKIGDTTVDARLRFTLHLGQQP